MAMTISSACNMLGSHPTVQLYLLLSIGMLSFLMAFKASLQLAANLAVLTREDIVDEITGLQAHLQFFNVLVSSVAILNFWILVGPRCCAPSCCGDELPDIPQPCPSTCEKVDFLDYPMVIAYVGFIFAPSEYTAILGAVSFCTGARKYYIMRHPGVSAFGRAVGNPRQAAMIVGRPVHAAITSSVRGAGLRAAKKGASRQDHPQEEGKPEVRESSSSDAAGGGSLGVPKVTGALDRAQAPLEFGTIELVDSTGADNCIDVVRALYGHLENGALRSTHVVPHKKYAVFVPETDLIELMEVSNSPDVIELRRQMERQSHRRAPRLKFFRSDGSRVKCAPASSSEALPSSSSADGECTHGEGSSQDQESVCHDGAKHSGENRCIDGGGLHHGGSSVHGDGQDGVLVLCGKMP
ncbi:unnamed protein product [Prorocentrum cordatum]|uniref:Uncharacterized protein n=1 Tax=Prorocentrum cordatum TaxID=2364126 RepID=A0ABN9XF50_9DINO|nr:unnamed protein product [Polarella glacialis]